MTCKQLGGCCDEQFTASTFDEIATLSKEHGMEMFQKQDAEHLAAISKMQELMSDPSAMAEWMAARKKEFDALDEE
tara:strand:+ start:2305 stop:2532 length:228 start_codon:yes stop_codon:yes gene_type:complete